MAFRNFRLQLILRVVILTAIITVLSWCIVHELYLRSVYVTVAAIISIVELMWYTDRSNRDVTGFMRTLLQRDFTTHYEITGRGKNLDALYETFNNISEMFKKISAEKEIQHKYLEMLVEHVRVSILSVDADEKVHLVNQALRDLLKRNMVTSLKMLESVDASLTKTIREIHAGETRLVKVNIDNELLQLSVHASEFKLDGRYFKLISMQNIKNELDVREMESWQKLIRVLSHEIMNSVSPISSLGDTLHKLVRQNQQILSDADTSLFDSLEKGLEAIKVRSEGLFNFTQTYRKLTHVPKPSLKKVSLNEILDRVRILLAPKIAENNVILTISNINVEMVADPVLMEHVFINLLLNAFEATRSREVPIVDIYTTAMQKGSVNIHIVDNGEGMDEATMEKIFIPFFTTRKNGSGIGLALTKQILHLHQADIQLKSEVGKGTEFIIVI
ncbi:MAG TPA: ATP-binding protein [Chryseolinea sp.]|nr:ATP-binding protein [Chryseolinea sp.]